MGCTSSTLSNRSLRNPRNRHRNYHHRHLHHQKQSISVVGLVLDRDYALRVIERNQEDEEGSNNQNTFSHLQIKQHLEEEEKDEEGGIGYGVNANPFQSNIEGVDVSSGKLCTSSSSSLSINVRRRIRKLAKNNNLHSPPKLSTLQERRLRRANLEVGSIGFSSDDDDNDEGDGFEFAKLKEETGSFGAGKPPLCTSMIAVFCDEEENGSSKTTNNLEVLSLPRSSDSILLSSSSSSFDREESSLLWARSTLDFPPPKIEMVSSQCGTSSSSSVTSSSPPYFEDVSVCEPPTRIKAMILGSPFSDASDDCGCFSPSSTCLSETITESLPPNDAFVDDDDDGTIDSRGWNCSFEDDYSSTDHPSPPSSSSSTSTSSSSSPSSLEHLIPSLPDDLAQLCLMRVPFIKYNHIYRAVSRKWRLVLSSDEFYKMRKALGIGEVHISFVVHGNRVQIFSLNARQWFCLPPLPRENGNVCHSPESDGAYQSSPRDCTDWGIDPYDWWQIDTVAVSEGTLFVLGGDKAEIHSFRNPSKPTNRVHKYDFCRNCWVSVSSMQVARSHAAATSLGKSMMYVAGGSGNEEEGCSAECYDSEKNEWNRIPRMNTSMRTCVGLEHEGCFYVKGESREAEDHVDGEIFDPSECRWRKMSHGMKRGLERGPIASCGRDLFVADWKDSVLKVYVQERDSWFVVTKLPARISRLVGHSGYLYGLTGKVKVDPYNHQIISDAPAEVWRLRLRESNTVTNSTMHHKLLETSSSSSNDEDDLLSGKLYCGDCKWECLWWDPKQMVKTGGLAWVPCIAHCTLFED